MKQRRLARAVRADDPDPIARLQAVGEPVENAVAAVGFADAVELEDLVAEPGRGRRELDLSLGFGLRPCDDGFRPLDVSLLLRRPGFRPLPEPGEFAADQILMLARFRITLGFLLGLLFEVVRVTPFQPLDAAALDLENAVRHAVEEIPVVRHQEQRAFVFR